MRESSSMSAISAHCNDYRAQAVDIRSIGEQQVDVYKPGLLTLPAKSAWGESESLLHSLLRAIILEHLLLPAVEPLSQEGSQLPWLDQCAEHFSAALPAHFEVGCVTCNGVDVICHVGTPVGTPDGALKHRSF